MSAQAKFNAIYAGNNKPTPDHYKSNQFRTSPQEQFDLDVALWWAAIRWPTKNEDAGLLTRLFGVLYYGGIQFKDNTGTWHDWHTARQGLAPTMPVAAALSHGGRVLIQLPPTRDPSWQPPRQTSLLISDDKQEHLVKNTLFKSKGDPGDFSFWNWLNGDTMAAYNRVISTHGLQLAEQPTQTTANSILYLDEKKGSTAGVKHTKRGRHYAVNPALGGLNQLSPLSGQAVKGDGLDAHLYFLYLPPTEYTCGGLLVGCENAQYGTGDNRHTGGVHVKGLANEFSATGGLKWAGLAGHLGGPIPVGECGDVLVDLTGSLGTVKVQASNFDIQDLDQCPQASSQGWNFPFLYSDAQWADLTEKSKGKRSNTLQSIDDHLKLLNAKHPTRPHLQKMLTLCEDWTKKNSTKKLIGNETIRVVELQGEGRHARHIKNLRTTAQELIDLF